MAEGDEVNELDEKLFDAIVAFTACVGDAVEDVCSYGFTIGESYVPFDPDPEDDCEEDEVACSQLWVRVTDIQPSIRNESFAGDDCALVLQMGLEVGVYRCVEIPEDGQAPTATDVLTAGLQALADMRAIHCAAMGCEVWDSISTGLWSPTGPLGGQYGGIWTFSVEI